MGAYGLRILCAEASDALRARLPRAHSRWPSVSLRLRRGGQLDGPDMEVDEGRASVRLPGRARALLDRAQGSATLVSHEPLGEDRLLHPALAYVASVFSHWHGRLVLHGGAVAADRGALALLGTRGAGKSSTLGWLAMAGSPMLTDDVLVLDGLTAFAGPRSIDLRRETADYLGIGGGSGAVRGGSRRRLAAAAVEPELPLLAWVTLAWGDRVAVRRLEPAERYAALVSHLHVHLDGRLAGAATLLELLALPAFELTRPRSLDSLPAVGEALIRLAADE